MKFECVQIWQKRKINDDDDDDDGDGYYDFFPPFRTTYEIK